MGDDRKQILDDLEKKLRRDLWAKLIDFADTCERVGIDRKSIWAAICAEVVAVTVMASETAGVPSAVMIEGITEQYNDRKTIRLALGGNR